MSKFEEQFNAIIKGWSHTPAKVICKVIQRDSQLPNWQLCPKDHVYIGVIERVKGDKVVCVKHRMSMELDLTCSFSDFTPEDLVQDMPGLFPEFQNPKQICSTCKEFSTRINYDGLCQDCNNAMKKAR